MLTLFIDSNLKHISKYTSCGGEAFFKFDNIKDIIATSINPSKKKNQNFLGIEQSNS